MSRACLGALAAIALAGACGFEAPAVPTDAMPGIDAPDAAPPDPGAWVAVSSGGSHACGIQGSGALYCWGDNSAGQLGTNYAQVESNVPVRVGTATWKQVVAGWNGTCGIQVDRSLWCWGSNSYGETGADPSLVGAIVPEPRQITGTFESVSLGYYDTCALTPMHELACWGANSYGELGNGTTTPTHLPQRVAGSWMAVSTGLFTTCGIKDDRSLWCWGNNNSGQVGIGSLEDQLMPVVIGGESWAQVGVGYNATCGVTMDGHARCWGNNANGQLGDATDLTRNVPTPVDGDDTNWAEVDTGILFTCGRRLDQTLWCWGWDQVGTYAGFPVGQTVRTEPQQVGQSIGPVAALGERIGFYSACVVTVDGHAACSGYNPYGGLGSGRGGSRLSPFQIEGSWALPAAGAVTTCASKLGAGAGVSCWGNNDYGAFGTNDRTPHKAPFATPIATPVSLASGYYDTCFVKADDKVFCTGYNGEHQVSDTTDAQLTPTRVGTFTALAVVARRHACALPKNATGAWCWGYNSEGQLGAGDAAVKTDPVQVFAGNAIASVAVGGEHTCFVGANTIMACVGKNSNGQLGDSTTMSNVGFVMVPGVWRRAVAGFAHTCGIDSNGALACWGRGSEGQLGVDSLDSMTSPTAVPAPTFWTDVSAGDYHTCGIQGGGSLWCWGSNSRGQVGDGTTTTRLLPVRIGANKTWLTVAAGATHTCALADDTTLWCWGSDAFGQIGDDLAWRASWETLP